MVKDRNIKKEIKMIKTRRGAERYNRNLHRIFEDAELLKATYTGHSCVICKEGITWEEDETGTANICNKCSMDIPY